MVRLCLGPATLSQALESMECLWVILTRLTESLCRLSWTSWLNTAKAEIADGPRTRNRCHSTGKCSNTSLTSAAVPQTSKPAGISWSQSRVLWNGGPPLYVTIPTTGGEPQRTASAVISKHTQARHKACHSATSQTSPTCSTAVKRGLRRKGPLRCRDCI